MQIKNFKKALNHENYVAEFSIEIPQWNMTFHKFKVRSSKQGHMFISGPSFSEEVVGGEKKWCNFVEFSKEKKFDFDKKVMELIEPLLAQPKETQSGYNTEDLPF